MHRPGTDTDTDGLCQQDGGTGGRTNLWNWPWLGHHNGDQMSMYAVNASVPKTLVASLVRWIAHTEMEEQARKILLDILDTPFSPELLPADNEGKISQKTEHFIGPYELHDFFLHRMLRYGDSPRRIRFIAQQAFAHLYPPEDIEMAEGVL